MKPPSFYNLGTKYPIQNFEQILKKWWIKSPPPPHIVPKVIGSHFLAHFRNQHRKMHKKKSHKKSREKSKILVPYRTLAALASLPGLDLDD